MLLASEEERKAGPTKSGVPQSSPTLLIPAGLHGAITVPESGESQDVIDRDRGTRAFARLEPTGSGQLESTPTQTAKDRQEELLKPVRHRFEQYYQTMYHETVVDENTGATLKTRPRVSQTTHKSTYIT